MELPLISIITVVYNGAETLESTIRSVINQSYPAIEYIIIDGGSTDRTIEIIQKYEKNISFWVSEKDHGVYDAMNKGIRSAKGEWIYFLGCDDVLYNNNVVSDIFSHSQVHEFDFLYGNIVSSLYKGKYDGEYSTEKLLKKNICHQAIFCKKYIYGLVGDYNLNFKTHADWAFNILCFFKEEIKKKYIDIVVANFAAGGLSSNYDLDFFRQFLIPQKIRYYNRNVQDKLMPVAEFDDWWRLIRNADITSLNEVERHLVNEEIPDFVSSIIHAQQHISRKILKTGITSKLFMMLSYIRIVIQIKQSKRKKY